MAENIHGAKEYDILFPETCVKISLGKRHTIANALVIARSLRKFFGVDHLHLEIEGTDGFSVFIRLPCINIVTDSLVFGVVAQNCLRVWAFQVLNFDAEQVLYERLRDVLVAKDKPEHNRIRNVKIVEGFDVHKFVPIISLTNKSTNENWQVCKQLFAKNRKKFLAGTPCMNYREAA
jgi:hypothetical protein